MNYLPVAIRSVNFLKVDKPPRLTVNHFNQSFNNTTMKIVSFVLLLLLCFYFTVIAQPPPRHPDTTRIGFNAARAEAIDAPILRGNGQGMTLVPNRQQFCFDLEMDVELNFGGRISREVAVFINTTDGYLGYTTPSAGGPKC